MGTPLYGVIKELSQRPRNNVPNDLYCELGKFFIYNSDYVTTHGVRSGKSGL